MSIDIAHPWARTSPGLVRKAGGYLTITNRGGEPDRLVAAATPFAGKVEIHGIKVVGPDIAMRPLENGLRLPPDTTITLKPRGYHLLLQELKSPFVKGERVPLTLSFEKAGAREIELVVEDQGPIGFETLNERHSG